MNKPTKRYHIQEDKVLKKGTLKTVKTDFTQYRYALWHFKDDVWMTKRYDTYKEIRLYAWNYPKNGEPFLELLSKYPE